MYELYIVLSDFCNFSCAHCINSSGPRSNKWRLGQTELADLINFVNTNLEISRVHFSGGEPTLHENLIKEIQKGVFRPVEYLVTTNGWLGTRVESFLDQIKIDEIILSYDKFHLPFVKIDTLVSFITNAKKKGVPVTINFTFEEATEISIATPLVQAGATLQTCKLINSGRAFDAEKHLPTFVSNALSGTCPSLEKEKNEGFEKMIYIPGQGLTPCCGPLAFDQQKPKEELFSDVRTNYAENKLRKKLDCRSFSSILSKNGFDTKDIQFASRCEACSWLFSNRIGKRSLLEIIEETTGTIYVKTGAPIDFFTAKFLQKRFVVSEFLIANLDGQPGAENSRPNLRKKLLNKENLTEVESFIRTNYYEPNGAYYSKEEVDEHCKSFTSYFESGATGLIHYYQNTVVSVILKSFYRSHPSNGEPSTHIGYWGIDKTKVTKLDSTVIKADWLSFLKKDSPKDGQFDCSVEWFNSSSINFAKKMGFSFYGIRLEPRCLR
jgi:hypothetical protein